MKNTRKILLLLAVTFCLSASQSQASDTNMLTQTQHPKAGAAGAPAAGAAAPAAETQTVTVQWTDVPGDAQKAALSYMTKGQSMLKIQQESTVGADKKDPKKVVVVYEFWLKNPDGKKVAMWISEEGKWVDKTKK